MQANVGDTVLYVTGPRDVLVGAPGEIRPAIVVRVDQESGHLDLMTFYMAGSQGVWDVPYSEKPKPRTWHFKGAGNAQP